MDMFDEIHTLNCKSSEAWSPTISTGNRPDNVLKHCNIKKQRTIRKVKVRKAALVTKWNCSILESYTYHSLDHQASLILRSCPTGGILFYKVSVRSLFIFAIRAETLRSIVRSPISTTSPPRISGLTLLVTFSFFP